MNKKITRKINLLAIVVLLIFSMSLNVVKAEDLENIDNGETIIIDYNLEKEELEEENLETKETIEENTNESKVEEPTKEEVKETNLNEVEEIETTVIEEENNQETTTETIEETPSNLEEDQSQVEVIEENKEETNEEQNETFATVNVFYVDQEGDRITGDEVYTDTVNSVYNTFKKDIENYVLVDIQGNTSGLFTEEEINIYYIYALKEEENKAIELGTVKVEYVSTSGEKLKENVELNDEIGKTYYTQELTFPNFYHVETEGEEVGTYTKEEKNVKYVYDNTTVIKIRFVDNNENEISDSIYMIGKIGNEYNTKEKEISGYVLTKEPNNKKGIFTEETQIVTYTYEKEGIGKTENNKYIKLSKKIPPVTNTDNSNYHIFALLLLMLLLSIKLKYRISG